MSLSARSLDTSPRRADPPPSAPRSAMTSRVFATAVFRISGRSLTGSTPPTASGGRTGGDLCIFPRRGGHGSSGWLGDVLKDERKAEDDGDGANSIHAAAEWGGAPVLARRSA